MEKPKHKDQFVEDLVPDVNLPSAQFETQKKTHQNTVTKTQILPLKVANNQTNGTCNGLMVTVISSILPEVLARMCS
jgi:hypothetical protein